MAAEPKPHNTVQIPVLTEAVTDFDAEADADAEAEANAAPGTDPADTEALIAELQTQIAADAFALTDGILRSAFAEMEASIFERITSRLRSELPEVIDQILRERLGQDTDF